MDRIIPSIKLEFLKSRIANTNLLKPCRSSTHLEKLIRLAFFIAIKIDFFQERTMFPLKEPDVRFRIQVIAPNPLIASALEWSMQQAIKQEGELPPDDADKLLTTGWLATAEEALQMFQDIC